ncbi:MAG: LPS export ABC transporter permease LptF [Candidatus Desulfaltia sp.]|nr:LPS export ABC transporter permease LptF [Candidatus Desulfaltia sp.]
MQINSIINRYLFKEMLQPFVINILFFTFVFLLTRILDIVNLIVNYKIGLSAVFLMLIYSVPHFLEFVIPISIMMSVLLTFLRLSADNEIIALKAGGVSAYGLLPPVFLFCLMGCLLTGFMTIYGVPWSRLSFKTLTYDVVTSNADIGLKERTFNDRFEDVMIYVNKVDLRNKALINVFIEDQRNKNIVSTVIAPTGKLFSEPDKLAFHLRLYNGTINQVDLKGKAVHSINFDTYDINLDLKKAVCTAKSRQKDEKEMSLSELSRYLHSAAKKDIQYYSALIVFHKKFSLPFACFVLGLVAIPLGIESSSSKRSFGLGLGLVFFLVYYFMLSAGWVFGETGLYPPVIGMWAPNIVIGSIGLYLFIRTANERPITIYPVLNLFKGRGNKLK